MPVHYPSTPEYFSSSKIEKRAIELVISYERKHGRNPKDVSRSGCGYDLESDGRFIEVKGMSHPTGDFISLYKKLLTKLGEKISNYYIYVVFDLKNTPKLKIIPPEVILGNLEIEPSFFIKAKAYRDIKIEEL